MISVIVPAYNAAATITDCLTALQNQTMNQNAYEIIVVDDASTDNTAVLANQPGVTLIRSPRNKGAAAARNQGLAVAQGDLICFTDADCVPQPDWLAQLTRPLQENQAIIAAKGIYATTQPQLVARFVQIEYEDKYDLMAGQPRIDFIDTYSAAYRQQAFTENGLFDETIYYVEDQEFSFRLAKRGCQMVFQPTAVVYHTHSNSLTRYARKKFWIGYWKARFIGRYPERVIQDSHTPQSLKLHMLLAALLLALVMGTVVFPPLSLAAGLCLLIFLLTTMPFCRKAWVKDRAVALASPGLLLIRAYALGFGFAWGSLHGRVHQ